MRAAILDLSAGRFEVALEARADGRRVPPASVTLTMRKCWQKPPVRLLVAYAYTDEIEQVAYYHIVDATMPGRES